MDVNELTGRERYRELCKYVNILGKYYATCQEWVLVIFHIHSPVIVNKYSHKFYLKIIKKKDDI